MEKIKKFKIKNYKIKIKGDPLVFYPSPHGTKGLGENIKIFRGESVLDIGTGTGILAILSAKMGGKVWAIDILENAIECTKKNADLNNVKLNIFKSDLFEKVPKRKFDVIIANVPQEFISPKIIEKLKPEIITGMNGRGDGSEMLVKTLKHAKKFMKSKTRLYIVVYSMSGWRNSLKYALRDYDVKLIGFYSGEVKKFVYDDVDFYRNNPKIVIYQKGQEIWADLFILELKMKDM